MKTIDLKKEFKTLYLPSAKKVEIVQERKKKGDSPSVSKLRLTAFEEGLCMQTMHIGPYATEPVTVGRVSAFALENGNRDHGGPHKADPAKRMTALRHPIERVR